MKKVLLIGNPNVGKSVVFSRLTGANVVVSNYTGTTVDFTKGKMHLDGENVEIIDAPGTYSLKPSNKAEEISKKMLSEADLVINVIDSTNLERNLLLTLQLLEKNIPMVVALNLWDETKRLGIEIDENKLEKLLKVPVVPIVALTGEGIKELVSKAKKTKAPKVKKLSESEKWKKIGKIIKEVQEVQDREHTLKERFADATIKPFTGVPIALAVVFLSFWFVRLIGENLIAYVFEPLFELYRPVAMAISGWLGPGFLHNILIGKLIEGQIEYVESMGILTTGLFVPFGMVLPYIIAFYFMLGLLEDSGYLPRLATLVDNLFHKLGMHGHGIVPVFLGLGCNVPGALATRVLETRKQRFIAATLLGISVPCMAQTAMIFGILGPYGVAYLAMVFSTLAVVYVIFGLLLNKMVPGESPEIFLEIPPYRKPSISTVLKKTWMRIKWFLTEAIPWLFFGVLLINVLYAIGFIGWFGGLLAPTIHGLLGLPPEAATALLVGFLRKDLAVGMLLPLGMSAVQLVIAATILTIYFPCVATFAVLIKELGIKDMAKSAVIMIGAALLVGSILKLILIGV